MLNWQVRLMVAAHHARPPQAESLWLHLPIITELATMCHRVFAGGSVQYAYTTIPTYPRCQRACWCNVLRRYLMWLSADCMPM